MMTLKILSGTIWVSAATIRMAPGVVAVGMMASLIVAHKSSVIRGLPQRVGAGARLWLQRNLAVRPGRRASALVSKLLGRPGLVAGGVEATGEVAAPGVCPRRI
jgi:hypothetical protein